MKSSWLLILFLVMVVPLFPAEKGQSEFLLSGGYGLSGASFSVWDGRTLGEWGLGDSTLFQSSAAPGIVYSWNIGFTYSYYFDSNFSVDIGADYSYQPFSVIYTKDKAPADLVFLSNFQLIKVPVTISGHWGWFVLSGGLSYEKIILNNSTISMSTIAVDSDIKNAKDAISFLFEPGIALTATPNVEFRIFIKYDQDITEIYSTPYWISSISLIDISANAGIAYRF